MCVKELADIVQLRRFFNRLAGRAVLVNLVNVLFITAIKLLCIELTLFLKVGAPIMVRHRVSEIQWPVHPANCLLAEAKGGQAFCCVHVCTCSWAGEGFGYAQ